MGDRAPAVSDTLAHVVVGDAVIVVSPSTALEAALHLAETLRKIPFA